MFLKVSHAGYGQIEDNGQLWANVESSADYEEGEGRAGAKSAKTKVSTDNNNAIGKRLVGEILNAKGDIYIQVTAFGNKNVKGNMVQVIKDFIIAPQPQSKDVNFDSSSKKIT